MIEEDDNLDNMLNLSRDHAMQQEQDASKFDFTHITKHPYLDKVFCWIESDETQQVIRFFDTFPHLLNNFNSPNNWNPILYAVRYGNMKLIDYFKQKQMKIMTTGILTTVSIVHTAVYSGQPSTLQYVVNKLGVPVNPVNCQISPLKVAMKANNAKMVEFLVSRGAYYVFGDVYNNLDSKQNVQDANKYHTLPSRQQPSKDISQALVVEQTAVRDCPIKQTLRFARVKPLVCMRKNAVRMLQQGLTTDHPFYYMAQILSNDNYYNTMLKVAANKGASILQKHGPADGNNLQI